MVISSSGVAQDRDLLKCVVVLETKELEMIEELKRNGCLNHAARHWSPPTRGRGLKHPTRMIWCANLPSARRPLRGGVD